MDRSQSAERRDSAIAPLAETRDWALFLDIDGTLVELVDDPSAAAIDASTRELLDRLDRHLGGATAIVSGRTIASIDSLFWPTKRRAAGLYGLEVRSQPAEPAPAAVEPAAIAGLATRWNVEFGCYPGILIERKGPVLSVNTGHDDTLLQLVTRAAERALASLPGQYRIVAGSAGIELLPLEAHKGDAIRNFMAMAPFALRTPIFIGDGEPDEHAFFVVNRMGGISIRVGPGGPTHAHFQLDDVAAVKAWLSDPAFPNLETLETSLDPSDRRLA